MSAKGKRLVVEFASGRVLLVEMLPSPFGFQIGEHAALYGDDLTVAPDRIRAWAKERGIDSIHAIVPDEAWIEFEVELPAMKRRERRQIVERHARARCELPTDTRMVLTHTTKPAGDDRERITVEGVAITAFGACADLLDELPFATVCCRSEAAVSALPRPLPDRFVLVDSEEARLRFSLVVGGEVVLDRTTPFDRTARTSMTDDERARLRLEVDRTTSWFEGEFGLSPDSVTFTPSLGLEYEAQVELAHSLTLLELPFVLVDDDEDEALVGSDLSVLGMLQWLSGSVELSHVSMRTRRSVPRLSARDMAVVAAAALLLVIGMWFRMSKPERAAAPAIPVATEPDPEPAAEVESDAPEEDPIARLVARRRPASAWLSHVANAAQGRAQLTGASFDTAGMKIEGSIDESDRALALERLRALRVALEDASFWESRDFEWTATSEGFRFVLSAAWRPDDG